MVRWMVFAKARKDNKREKEKLLKLRFNELPLSLGFPSLHSFLRCLSSSRIQTTIFDVVFPSRIKFFFRSVFRPFDASPKFLDLHKNEKKVFFPRKETQNLCCARGEFAIGDERSNYINFACLR